MDLTLRQCKKCTVGDAIGVAIVCEFDLYNLYNNSNREKPTQMWRSLWHRYLCYSSTLESPMNLKDVFSLFKYIIIFPC